ncbi:ACP phosphodiesterase [Amphritea sp.]|uniref:acyl carrier protein phosphodiesterase n=1 Tax=Amphritea sp. TaxID=1872502 RepID=UPI003D0FB27B
MNFFAHLVLAEATVESRVGNLLGDFARGVDQQALSAEVLQGLINHRRVDQFTDQHLEVQRMKRLFSQRRRRFAGIALDVLFDHYLLNHWQQFSSLSKKRVIEVLYEDLIEGQSLMPPSMQQVTRRIVDADWFGSYERLEGIAYALDRIAGRIRFNNQFQGVGEELMQHYPRFEAGFQLFFADLAVQFPSPLIDSGN